MEEKVVFDDLLEPDVSIGTNATLRTISTLSVPIDVVFINTLTIVRNALNVTDKDQFQFNQRLQKNAWNDLQKIMTYLSLYSNRIGLDNLTVLFYYNNDPIAKDYQRDVTPKKKIQNDLLMNLAKNIFKAKLEFNYLRVIKSAINGSFTRAISPWLRSNFKKYPKITGLLISHQPLHYHLVSKIEKLMVMKSYTGEILSTPLELGNYVFKEDLPFTQYMHLLFGDKENVKPFAKGNIKKNVLTKAKSNNWKVKPMMMIREDILSLGGISTNYLDNFHP